MALYIINLLFDQRVIILYFALVFAMLGMLSPASRGSLIQAIILVYVFMGLVFICIVNQCVHKNAEI